MLTQLDLLDCLGWAVEQDDVKIASPYSIYRHIFDQAAIIGVDTLDFLYRRRSNFARSPVAVRTSAARRKVPRDWFATMDILSECGIGAPRWRILGPSTPCCR